jgi:hypothetical protein
MSEPESGSPESDRGPDHPKRSRSGLGRTVVALAVIVVVSTILAAMIHPEQAKQIYQRATGWVQNKQVEYELGKPKNEIDWEDVGESFGELGPEGETFFEELKEKSQEENPKESDQGS